MYKVEITNNNKYELELDRANVVVGSGGTVVPVWGTIIGDITQQKDLQEELTGIKESIPDLTQVNEDIANLESVKANKSEIPDVTGLATKEDLKSRVTMSYLGANYYKKAEIDKKLDAITSGEADLSNYYTKEETYSRKEIDEMMPTQEWTYV